MKGKLTLFQRAKTIEKNIKKRQISAQLIDKSLFYRPKSIEKNIEKR